MGCAVCDNTSWICENHPDNPFGSFSSAPMPAIAAATANGCRQEQRGERGHRNGGTPGTASSETSAFTQLFKIGRHDRTSF